MAEVINMPKLGFDMAEGTLIRWMKKMGDVINKGDILAEIETDKATVEVESPASGVVRKLLVDEGAVVPVNTPIAIVGTVDEKIEEPVVQKMEIKQTDAEAHIDLIPNDATIPVPPNLPGKASPLAKRMAHEAQVDLANVKGTGPGGRVVRRDIEAALSGGVKPVTGGLGSNFTAVSNADEAIGMSRLRQTIARRMAESKTSVPHFYVTHEYKMDALLNLRKQLNAIVQEEEKLTVNDFIIKAVALTLRKFPNLNASLSGNTVMRHGAINIGVAVSVEGGLMTVVCRDADQKPLRQVSAEVRTMSTRAREGKVRSEEIEGSSFSISNLGMYEVENFLAIINPPEAAILAIGTAREVSVVEEGVVKPGWRMKASLSVDHRVSDGVEGAKFMQALGGYLEEPLRLVL